MSRKEIVILIVLIVVFGGLYFLRNRDKVSYKLPVIKNFKKEVVDEIRIKYKKNDFDIVKKDGKWYLKRDGIPVKKGFVDNVLDKIADLKFVALVSTTGNYPIYKLDTEAVSLKLLSKGKEIVSLKIGKESPTYSQSYLLYGNDQNVYQVNSNLRNYVKKNKEEIIDRRVLNFEVDKVNNFAVKCGKEAFELTKKDNKWYFKDGKEANSDKVKEVLTSLSTLSAAEVLPEKKGKINEKPECVLTMTTDKDIELKCYGLKEKDYLCQSSQYPMPFSLTDTIYKTVVKNKSYFEKKEKKGLKKKQNKKVVKKVEKTAKNNKK